MKRKKNSHDPNQTHTHDDETDVMGQRQMTLTYYWCDLIDLEDDMSLGHTISIYIPNPAYLISYLIYYYILYCSPAEVM